MATQFVVDCDACQVEQRISLVTLGVTDLARARSFYEAMGWGGAQQPDEEVCFFQAGGKVLGLWTALGGHGAPGIELAQNVRAPRGCTSSKPSNPSTSSTAPARAANRSAKSSPEADGTVTALILPTVVAPILPARHGRATRASELPLFNEAAAPKLSKPIRPQSLCPNTVHLQRVQTRLFCDGQWAGLQPMRMTPLRTRTHLEGGCYVLARVQISVDMLRQAPVTCSLA